ncbi:MAG: CehA/McbA family metallohydrolase [Candidatus Dormiibacterota bacterium]
MKTRREFLKAAGAVGAGAAMAPHAITALAAPPPQTIHFDGTAVGYGQYLYFPFTVPMAPEVNRIDVKVTHDVNNSNVVKLGAGLFDHRGAQYQSPGFRGIYGEERSQFFVSAGSASQSFIPGTILPGTWTVVVPVFLAAVPTPVHIDITLSFGPQGAAFVAGPAQLGVVRPGAAWYRGDLHAHTPESSDAWGSHTAQNPDAWAMNAATRGLDFVAMTDHNVVSQNFNLAHDAGQSGTLLIAGEEMTNWAHGHATVTGIDVGQWLDWRQRPIGVPLGANEARIGEFIQVTRDMGAYVAAAHPYGANLIWDFWVDSDADPSGKVDPTGVEVWCGLYQPDDDVSVRQWDAYLRQGRRIYANGGSDIHGLGTAGIALLGTPTNNVYASNLSKADIVYALKHGRNFITRVINGGAVYLSASGPSGQHQAVGGTIYGEQTDVAHIEAVVRGGASMTLHLLHSNIGDPLPAVPQLFNITSNDQTIKTDVPVGAAGGFVRAELHNGNTVILPNDFLNSYMDMEVITNPVFLANGSVPPGTTPFFAPPPAIRATASGPLTLPNTDAAIAVSPAAAAAGLAAAGSLAAAGMARRGRPEPEDMSLYEVNFRSHAGDTLRGRVLRLAGQVTAVDESGDHVLTRWIHSCCASGDAPVSVRLKLAEAVDMGAWIEVTGRWRRGSGATGLTPTVVRCDRVRVLDEPPPCREDHAHQD